MENIVKLTGLRIKEGVKVTIVDDKKKLDDFFSKKVKVSCTVKPNVIVRLNRLTQQEIQKFTNPETRKITRKVPTEQSDEQPTVKRTRSKCKIDEVETFVDPNETVR